MKMKLHQTPFLALTSALFNCRSSVAFMPQSITKISSFVDSTNIIFKSSESDDIFDSWDPRLSPHMYPEGIPSKTTSANGVAQSKEKVVEKIGVLLIDHGSRKTESNNSLHLLAQQYQSSSICPPHVIVGAAHMELATPSIEMGIQNLIENGATRVICLPYFLSPGRHATEDIPRIIDEAKIALGTDGKDIPVTSTNYLGSNTDGMINLIGSMVTKSVRAGPKKQSAASDMGFFGEIMRMMEENIEDSQ